MRKDIGAEAEAYGPCSGLPRQPATRDGCCSSGSEHPASHSGACGQSCRNGCSPGGAGSAADSMALGGEQCMAGQGLEPSGQSDCRAGESINRQGGAGLGSGAGFVPARTAEYLEPGFWQRRFQRGDAHEWFGGYAAFRALLSPRLTPGRCCMLLLIMPGALCLHLCNTHADALLVCLHHL